MRGEHSGSPSQFAKSRSRSVVLVPPSVEINRLIEDNEYIRTHHRFTSNRKANCSMPIR